MTIHQAVTDVVRGQTICLTSTARAFGLGQDALSLEPPPAYAHRAGASRMQQGQKLSKQTLAPAA